MLILVDYRTGSADLQKLIPGSIITTLEYSDASFMGKGPDGTDICIGIEVKKWSDLLQCMVDGRFTGHQLPGLMKSFDRVYLLIEGIFQCGAGGLLEWYRGKGRWQPAGHGKRNFTYAEIMKWIAGIEEFGGVRVKFTSRRTETAAVIQALAQYWSRPYERHKSHMAFDESLESRGGKSQAMLLREPPLARQFAAKILPLVGWEKSLEVWKRFKTIRKCVNSFPEDWEGINGIGPIIADKVIKSFDKED